MVSNRKEIADPLLFITLLLCTLVNSHLHGLRGEPNKVRESASSGPDESPDLSMSCKTAYAFKDFLAH